MEPQAATRRLVRNAAPQALTMSAARGRQLDHGAQRCRARSSLLLLAARPAVALGRSRCGRTLLRDDETPRHPDGLSRAHRRSSAAGAPRAMHGQGPHVAARQVSDGRPRDAQPQPRGPRPTTPRRPSATPTTRSRDSVQSQDVSAPATPNASPSVALSTRKPSTQTCTGVHTSTRQRVDALPDRQPPPRRTETDCEARAASRPRQRHRRRLDHLPHPGHAQAQEHRRLPRRSRPPRTEQPARGAGADRRRATASGSPSDAPRAPRRPGAALALAAAATAAGAPNMGRVMAVSRHIASHALRCSA